MNEDETDLSDMSDYVAAEDMAVENGDTENTGTDSIIDELNLLLGDSDAASDAETETFDTALESDYSMSGISDETPALDKPVQDELDTNMARLSRDVDAADEISVEETAVDTSDTEPVSSSSNTIEELEAMLNEISSSGNDASDNDKTSEDIIVNEDDFSYEIETRQSFSEVVVDEVEADNIEAAVSVTHAPPVKTPEVNASAENVNLLHEQDNKGRLPVVGLLFAAALAVGIYSIWSLLNTDNEIVYRAEKTQVKRAYKPVAALEKPKTSAWSEPSVIEDRVTQEWKPDVEEKLSQDSILEETPVSVIPTETDSIYGLPKKTEASSYVPISSYEDEPLTIESTESEFENKVSQTQRIAGVYIESENRLNDMIGLQVDKLQQENRNSIKQLNRRMTEAETSITRLQEEKTTANQKDFVEPVRPASSEVPEKPELSVKHEVIEQPVQKVSANKAQGKDSDLWSVHLSSYYGKPPSASELEYLGNAGISYEIKKAIVNEKVWYRVIVDEFSEYEKAREYSDSIRKDVGRNDIWINRSQ